ncbi:nucleotide exchange factor GrpE [Mycobacterium sp. MYCO198283]|uniref:nucleotide exchange factor GrpE n=1 Tax=Mycobacterium sp. MYCO198283 TaxID=2883505 RepID=UPI001E4C5516|nr:nucleotide exchange factor GrpE [Mycobacterium sp. MYCO198283]MCG5432128.1 nucleotide exchange factor GrpE [Mycobacterium sp. MYCO198283]
MTPPTNHENDSPEPVTVTDKRRIDPVTGEIREPESAGPAPGEPAPAAPADSADDKVAELTADLQRVQADFANYRRRALRDQQLAAERGKAAVVTELLGVLDDLDRARSHGDLDSGPLKAVADKLAGVVTTLGLVPFGDVGDAFDPSLHEAVQHEGDGSNPVVSAVMRRGYRLGDHVLRHALVGVVDEPLDEGASGGDTVDSTASGESAQAQDESAESNAESNAES